MRSEGSRRGRHPDVAISERSAESSGHCPIAGGAPVEALFSQAARRLCSGDHGI
jgi:hypothetical protein